MRKCGHKGRIQGRKSDSVEFINRSRKEKSVKLQELIRGMELKPREKKRAETQEKTSNRKWLQIW